MSNTNGTLVPPAGTSNGLSLALKYAKTYIDGSAVRSKYDVFDKTPLEYGGIIEGARVPATAATTDVYNANTLIPAKFPAIDVRFFSSWTPKRFDTELRDDKIRESVESPEAMAELVATIVNGNNEGERLDANNNYKALFCNNTSDSVTTTLLNVVNNTAFSLGTSFLKPVSGTNLTEVLDFTDLTTNDQKYEAVYSELNHIALDMTFDNATYTQSFVCGADMSDLVMIVPTEFISGASVEFLSRLYNLQETQKLPQMIPTNTLHFANTVDGATTYRDAIIICDKRAIGRVWKGKEIYEWFNGIRLSHMFTTRLDDMYYYHPAYKAFAVVFPSI